MTVSSGGVTTPQVAAARSAHTDRHAPGWVAAVLPEEIVRQRALGWPDFHPEDFCHRCGRRNPVWFADTAAWDVAVAGRDRGAAEILCPSCFAHLHERNSGGSLWRVAPVDLASESRKEPT